MEHVTATPRRPLRGTGWAAALLLLCTSALAAPATVPLDDAPAAPRLSASERATARSMEDGSDDAAMRDLLISAAVQRHQGAFPLVDNAVVRAALDRLVGTPAARRTLAGALENRRQWATIVDHALSDAGVPPELAAIPVIESGYTNARVPSPSAPQGMWALMGPTARAYGLRVDADRDERMQPARAADAAARYLHALYGNFDDWGLALAAYNQGSSTVATVVRTHGTSDIWQLIERRALGDYAARVVAVALVMDEPALLQVRQE